VHRGTPRTLPLGAPWCRPWGVRGAGRGVGWGERGWGECWGGGGGRGRGAGGAPRLLPRRMSGTEVASSLEGLAILAVSHFTGSLDLESKGLQSFTKCYKKLYYVSVPCHWNLPRVWWYHVTAS